MNSRRDGCLKPASFGDGSGVGCKKLVLVLSPIPLSIRGPCVLLFDSCFGGVFRVDLVRGSCHLRHLPKEALWRVKASGISVFSGSLDRKSTRLNSSHLG